LLARRDKCRDVACITLAIPRGCVRAPTPDDCCNVYCPPDPILTTPLFWFEACGPPVTPECGTCGTMCPTGTNRGDRCRVDQATCTVLTPGLDPSRKCCSPMICAAEAPIICPRSKRDKKTQITYVSQKEKSDHYKSIMDMKLATYLYKDESSNAKKHLGFIIDDIPSQETSPAISASGQTVDLYGFVSMLVSTVQQQDQQIKNLQQEVSMLRGVAEEDNSRLKTH